MSENEDCDILIIGGCVVTMNSQRHIIRDGAVTIKNGTITDVTKAEQLKQSQRRAKRTIDATGKLVIPGLIDSHNHPMHFLSKGIADDMPVQQRWRERIWPYEAHLTAAETKLSAIGTFMEMIQSGTTCFNDPGSFYPDAVAQAAIEVGIRGVVSRIAWDVRDPAAPDYDDSTAEAFEKGEATVEKWHGAGEGQIRAAFSLVRSHHVTDELCKAVKRRAEQLEIIVHGHLCTTRQEVELSKQKTGSTPLERYRRLGILGPNLILVHMGWIEPQEVSTLAAHDVSVCHCPSASMFGGFGCIAHGKFPELVDAGVRVILGSDACAISRFVDMVRVIYLAACSHKDARADPTIIGAHKAFEMATIDAAHALGWEDAIGSLEVGKRADVVIADADGPVWHPRPFANPVANLVYSASGTSVRTVLIDGRVVLDDRQFMFVDVAATLAEADQVSKRVLDRHSITLNAPWPIH